MFYRRDQHETCCNLKIVLNILKYSLRSLTFLGFQAIFQSLEKFYMTN